jgi:hypothetical protein
VTMDFLPAQEGSAATWGESWKRIRSKRGFFSLSLSLPSVYWLDVICSVSLDSKKKEKGWAPFSYNMRFQAPLCWNRREGGRENVQDVCVCVSKGVKGMLLLLSSTSISAGRDICGCRGGDYRCLFIILFYSYTHPPFIWRGWWRRWVVWKLLIFPPEFSFFFLFYFSID